MGEPITFRIILALLLVGFVAHRGYYHRKLAHPPDSIAEERKMGVGSRIAAMIAVPALLSTLVYLLAPSWMSRSSISFPVWPRWLGVGVALAGFVMLQWSHQALGQNWSDEPRIVQGHQLVTSGPYRWVRHPIYAAFLLILGSPILISANWFLGGLWIAMTALDVTSRIRVEEDLMRSRFGDEYQAYMRRTGRLLPRIAGSNEESP